MLFFCFERTRSRYPDYGDNGLLMFCLHDTLFWPLNMPPDSYSVTVSLDILRTVFNLCFFTSDSVWATEYQSPRHFVPIASM